MNKRILEIAKQAGFGLHRDGEIYTSRLEHLPITEHIEKLAELVVRECMSQIEEVKRIQAGHAGPEYTQGFDDGMFVAIRTIEEHFGVE